MQKDFPFLSQAHARCPQSLLDHARRLPVPRVALVNAGGAEPLQGLREAAGLGLAVPVLIGDHPRIAATAEAIGWDITDLSVIHAPGPAAAQKAAEMARKGQVDAIMKGQLHTSVFLKALLPFSAGLRDKDSLCGHLFHLTMPGADRPLLLTDAAVNVAPDIATRQACLSHAVRLAQRLGIACPRVGLLAPTEDVVPAIPSTGEAAIIAAWAKTALPDAIVEGPMALDLIFSRAAAVAKGFASDVSGRPDIMLVPDISAGNALAKLMSLGMGCCAAGIVLGAKVPIMLTSRSQTAQDRIASAALGVIAAGMRA
ncbi:phosphate acyltransferase [Yoonia vestfoldensis]|uniref:Phosphate acetyltransferase n=1 Tax=Yoonia vestfoldensis TaxID=245188 RepID=A0A1Y0EDD0_9RHOB|nr:phosphate acyltransferase [Yoonia vestfoldensis]ARU01626.1 phosphate acetyltransferase [Yoonia vestfoldensis]